MLYLIDSANLEDIEALINCYPIVGVTTNPSIIAREEEPFASLVKDIRRIIGSEQMLHIQTSCETSDQIVQEALALQKLADGNFYAKIPVTPSGIQAIMQLKKLKVGVTATTIFTPQQALIAARAGADFVAPYVNRLDNIASNGSSVVSDIVHLFNIHNLETRVLAASFKNVEQVHQVSMAGAHCATIDPELFPHLIYHPLTDMSVAQFKADGPACPRWTTG
ncbi:MAG: transaldolase family protein [Armatimonadota bacterium]